MMNTVKAIFKEGRIELLEQIDIPEGTEVLVTILSDEAEFWLQASESSLASVWDNEEDDIYEQLLKR
jgi:predicted DNA-binding antitoxin AbrB/MazE fold protein